MLIKRDYGYSIQSNGITLHIQFITEDIVRLCYSLEDRLPQSTPAVVVNFSAIQSKVEDNKIITPSLIIEINATLLTVSIYDRAGNLLSKDRTVKFDTLEVKKELLWETGFYGMGEKYGWVNKLGSDTINWCSDVLGLHSLHTSTIKEYHTAIPFYIGLNKEKSYGIYFDNSYKTYFDFNSRSNGIIGFRADGGAIDYYFIYRAKASEVVEAYGMLTGKPPMVRKAFLGYQQCRWSYEDKDQLMMVAREMRERNIPCDVLYLDIDYMEHYKVFTVDSNKFDQFKDMLKRLKDMGFKVVVIIDPGIKVEQDYPVYKEGLEGDYYIKNSLGEVYIGEVWPGKSVFPDFLRQEVRAWWGNLHKALMEDGIEGIWNDMNEPSDFTTQSKTLPEDTIHRGDDGGISYHSQIHNLYGMLEAQATYEGLLRLHPNKRPFILTRAAFAGTQRYAALWTGDNASLWEHLKMSIPMFINLGLSGYSFVGADVGGFTGDCTGELLARWTQLGAFTPLFRNHSCKGTINQEPWSFGKEIEEITKKYIDLRYSLIPHIYNLMVESSKKGTPIIRPLFYHYQQEDKTQNINDQFLVGRDIMVCPITEPKTTARMLYLPRGGWYDYWTGDRIEGGKYIIKEAPLDTLPLYIREGAIIATTKPQDYIEKQEGQPLELHIYPGGSGKYNLYLDDGETFDYIEGNYSEISFLVEEEEQAIIVKEDILKESYPIPSIEVVIHGKGQDKEVKLEGKYISKITLVN